ncbi:cystathionine beta-synthase-like [Diorhabda carinulata]|uniref:cystathionine beta-synthase-like n=1 Tax=Diorhabda carinulata TaxID=1163345 RepID=UPI0025A2E8BA|nr:cystathionine beta-synthase-like [Diorhabda carinulata]
MSYVSKEQDYVFQSPLHVNSCMPDRAFKCPWTKDIQKTERSPHSKWNWKPNTSNVFPDVLAATGNTPMIKLNKIPKTENVECEIYGKCEFLNPVGSVKDRMVIRCIEDAERSGLLKPGATIIEASSGNTGISVAWAASVKGYKCIIVLIDKISIEKENLIKAFGGKVLRVSASKDPTCEEGLFGTVHRLYKTIPNSIVFDQFSNPSNPISHYDTTAEEIFHQCGGQVDMIVMGTGTGGTLTGISRKFREISPNTLIIGADPYGSKFAQPSEINETDVKFIEIEGIGFEMIATVCDRSQVDKWYKLYDKDSLNMSRRMIREEGLLVGTSSGVIMAGALKAIKDFKLGKGKKVVVLLPDGTRNYLTKFVREQWMEQRGFIPCINTNNHWWWDLNATEIKTKPLKNVSVTTSLEDVLVVMNELNVDYLPVEEDGILAGIVSRKNITNELISCNTPKEEVKQTIERMYSKLPKDSNVGLVSRVLEAENYVVLLESQDGIDKALKIITSDDVLSFIQSKNEK